MSGATKELVGAVLVVLIFAATIAGAAAVGRRREMAAVRAGCAGGPGALATRPAGTVVAGVLDTPRRSPGTPWDADGNVVFGGDAIVSLGDPPPVAPEIEVSLDHNDTYRLHWFHRGREVGSPAEVGPSHVEGGGLAIYRVRTAAREVDLVVIVAVSGDGKHSVGHVVPVRP